MDATTPPLVPAPNPPRLKFSLYASKVIAGFPSPADDYVEKQLDLNELLVTHKEATFFVRVQGHSMVNAGIRDGDLLIVDRTIEPAHCNIVVAVLDGEFTVKTLYKRRDLVKLVAANESFPDIEIGTDSDLTIWGVVTHVIHSFSSLVRAG